MPMTVEIIYRWYLVIDQQEVFLPTIEHALNLGRYLLGKNVPVRLVKKTTMLRKKSNGTVSLPLETTTEDLSAMLTDNNDKLE